MLRTISEDVPVPIPLDKTERMAAFTEQLGHSGYNLASCAGRLGVFPRLGVNFWREMRPNWSPDRLNLVDTLVELFIDGCQVEGDRLSRHFSAAFIEAAREMQLVEESDGVFRSRVCLFPCYDKYISTDRPEKNTAINQVMWLWGESYILGGLVKRSPRRRAVDIGTGSGVHAILASGHCQRVLAADVNPRALAFAQFNATLNGLSNIEFVLSDVFGSVSGTCDLLLANPPYAPDSAAKAGDNFWSGGVAGTDILRQIVHAIPSRLDPDGACHLIALYPNAPGTTIKEHFDHWLDGTVSEYEVLDHTWPVPSYNDLLSEEPFRGDKTAWRFGVVSIRRARCRLGWWKEVAGKKVFFGRDGGIQMVADHDAA